MVFSAIDFDSKNCAMNAFFLLRQPDPEALGPRVGPVGPVGPVGSAEKLPLVQTRI